MRDISELLEQLENQLEQRASVTRSTAQPDTPTAILYAGRRSLEAQIDMEQTLRRVWRIRADAVCHFLLDQGGYAQCSGGRAMGPITESDVIDQIEGMFGDGRSFHRLTSLFLCLVQTTEQYRSLEEFQRDYLALDALAERMDFEVMPLKLVLLDASNKGRELSDQIRQYLRSEIHEGRVHRTVILSNRLSNGQLLKNQTQRENYSLAGGILLVANGWNQNFRGAYPDMFPVNSRDVLTASYSRVTRPNRDICEVMVNTLLEWLGRHLDRTEPLSVSAIAERLEITGGLLKPMVECFRSHLSGSVLPREALECLPRSAAELGPIAGLPFEQFNQLTMGSFGRFFEQNALPLCRSESNAELFRQEFRRFVRDKFSPREAGGSLTPQSIDAVLGEINISEPARKTPAYSYMCKLLEARYCETMLPVCREVLSQLGQEARDYITRLRSLVDSFNLNYMLDVEPTVKAYYEPLVLHALNGELGLRLTERLNRERMDDQMLLEALYDTLATIIGSHEIFTMNLADEMAKRLGGNNSLMQTTIRKVLLDNLSDKIRLRSVISPNKAMDVVLMDTSCEIFGFLEDMYPDMRRMDTSSGSAVELIQFFRVGETVI